MNFGQKSPECDFGKRGIFGRGLGPLRRGSLDAARMACGGPGATNCLGLGLGYGSDDFGQPGASQVLLARRPPGRRCAGRPVELESGGWVRGVGQELADLGVPEAHGEGTLTSTAMTERHRDWRGGIEREHSAGPQAHGEIARHGAGLVGRCRDSGGGQAQAVLEWRWHTGRVLVANPSRASVHCYSKADTRTQSNSQLRAVAARVGAPAAKRSCRCRGGRMPTPGESTPRSRRCASRAQTGARSEDARHATMSQSAHQRRSFRGEAMPATWSFRLVPLRFRNLHAPSSFTRVGLLGFAG
jgi:hypothetical protein